MSISRSSASLSGLIADWAGRPFRRQSDCVAFVCDWISRIAVDRDRARAAVKKGVRLARGLRDVEDDAAAAFALTDKVFREAGFVEVEHMLVGDVALMREPGSERVHFGVAVNDQFIAFRGPNGPTVVRYRPDVVYRMVA